MNGLDILLELIGSAIFIGLGVITLLAYWSAK